MNEPNPFSISKTELTEHGCQMSVVFTFPDHFPFRGLYEFNIEHFSNVENLYFQLLTALMADPGAEACRLREYLMSYGFWEKKAVLLPEPEPVRVYFHHGRSERVMLHILPESRPSFERFAFRVTVNQDQVREKSNGPLISYSNRTYIKPTIRMSFDEVVDAIAEKIVSSITHVVTNKQWHDTLESIRPAVMEGLSKHCGRIVLNDKVNEENDN